MIDEALALEWEEEEAQREDTMELHARADQEVALAVSVTQVVEVSCTGPHQQTDLSPGSAGAERNALAWIC